ncbi:unnamed protein product [Blepharisma stoltei]|uniref:Uncharacterized protein n=1 Tax=Blepharisma stoltei TaxID=1481888 RepID=A0AAU9I5R4_9CILI|nr:unnamed protein product [Blepharisma stoltei]
MLKSLFGKLRQARKAAQPPTGTPYFEKLTKHRQILPLYDLYPIHQHSFVAPNASLIGEVFIGRDSAVMYGTVVRGDINKVTIMNHCYVGENSVLHTAASLPTGAQAELIVGISAYVGPNCVLYSCILEDFCQIGAGTVILEGARVEKYAIVLPNSVIPPGRLIPSKQVWGGNPVQFIKNVYEMDEVYLRDSISSELKAAGEHMRQLEDFGHAHMYDS